MRIVFVLENYFPNIGGVESLFKSLVESLAQEGHDIIIVTSRITPDSLLKEKKGNIFIRRMPFNNRYLFTILGFFYALPYIRQCHLVHTTSYNAAVPAFFAAKLFGKKIIITFHEVWADLWNQLPYMGKLGKIVHNLFEQFLLRLPFNHFVGVSESTSTNLAKAGIKKEKISTIYNGIDYTEFQEITAPLVQKQKKFTYTYFGRLGISKGLDLLMAAIPAIQSKYPTDSQINLIVPKVPVNFLKKIEDFIQHHQLSEYVILKHHLSFEALKKEIKTSHCVIIPSYSEGFCFAAVETIALGTPLISSNQTALKEVVSGQFIKMEDLSVDSLIIAMEKAKNGKWENTPIRKFELKETIEQYNQLYKRVLK